MKIGFLYMHAPGESMGSIYRIRNFCKGLVLNGHSCYILSPFNYEEDWGDEVSFVTIPTLSSSGRFSRLIYKIIRKVLNIRFISKYSILNPKIFNSTMNKISKGLVYIIEEESIELDVIIGETEVAGLILIKAKDKLSIPIITDYQNFWPEELIEHKIIKRNKKKYKYFMELEKEIINDSDLVITPSVALMEFLIQSFPEINKDNVKAVINGGKSQLTKPKEKTLPPKIINAGLIVERSNMPFFFESLPYILEKYPETQIYITKKGELLKNTMKMAKKMKIDINFYWKEKYQDFLDLLSECHVGVVSSSLEISRKLGFVTKIYDYFSVGIPVVGNDIGGWTTIISEENVGLLSKNDPKDFAEKVIELIENPNLSKEMGNNGIELLQGKLNEEKTTQKLVDCIKLACSNFEKK